VKWDKRKLHSLLLERLKAELAAILNAAEMAKEGSNHEDAVAKSKYDTHGLELSYLAGSQFERARTAEAKIGILENSLFIDYGEDDEINIGALVRLEGPAQKARFYLISDIGAGLDLEFQGEKIFVISPESPLGETLMGHYEGESVESKERQLRAFTIASVN
jgi:transcription elongation GreA/GreB family factor